MNGAEVRGEGKTIKSPWARGSPSPTTPALQAGGGERDRSRRADSGGDRGFFCHRKLGRAAGKEKGRRNEKAVTVPRPPGDCPTQ